MLLEELPHQLGSVDLEARRTEERLLQRELVAAGPGVACAIDHVHLRSGVRGTTLPREPSDGVGHRLLGVGRPTAVPLRPRGQDLDGAGRLVGEHYWFEGIALALLEGR